MSETRLYRYDTHIHTSEGSKCAKSSGREVAEAYHARGYDGIIITDHFFNGNSTVPRDLPWRERVALFTAGYRAAKEYGDKVDMQVFFGWEDSSEGNDFLTYGLDENWLADHPFIDRLPLVDYLKYIRSEGGTIVHAHPFRQDYYIPMIRLLPDLVDAVEIQNGHRKDEENRRAKWYADSYNLPWTAGSDNHDVVNGFAEAGVLLDERLTGTAHYARLVLERRIRECFPHLDGCC